MSILKKILLVIVATLGITSLAVITLTGVYIADNNNKIVSSVFERFQADTKRNIELLDQNSQAIEGELNRAGQSTRKIILDLYNTSFNTLALAMANQIFPMIESFDFDSPKTVVASVLGSNDAIKGIRLTTSKNPSDADILKFGDLVANGDRLTFAESIDGDFAYLLIEIQVSLEGLQELEKVGTVFSNINENNKKVADSLHENTSSSLENARVFAQEVGDIQKSKLLRKIILVMLICVILACVLMAFFIRNSIIKPIDQAVHIIAKIGQGDTSERMSPGKAIKCSNIKKCNEQKCPSYGKEDHCWVTSGSFAVIKHCPRAKKGEDCRTCEIYGAKTEMEELGSILAGLENFLNDREKIASRMANGDLTSDVEIASGKDNFGKAFKRMVENLREMISQVQTASNDIKSGSIQVSDSSQLLSQGASEQAASLEEISGSMNEMASQTSKNAENANQAKELSQKAKNDAENGAKQMGEMVGAMDEINNASKDISKIIKVIDEIAFQTNLLALNAAVEAARAGKHGRGFAVVAEEVRNLAARSAKAAKETAELIEGTVDKTRRGAEIAQQTSVALQGIVESITSTTELVDMIAGASNEQAQGLSQVNLGIGQIDQVTQQNTANAEETAAAAEELSSQAREITGMLSSFRLKEQLSPKYDRNIANNLQQKISGSIEKYTTGATASGNKYFRDVPSKLISSR